MKHFFEAVALLGLAAAAGAQTEAAKPGRQMDNQNRGSAPPAPKPAPNLRDPGANIAQRLLAMTPEQRERALEKFPPEQQEKIREQLQRLDGYPAQQKQRMIKEYKMMASLPVDIQLAVRRQIQAFNRLPEERKLIVGKEMQRLRQMAEADREARIASDDFKTKFNRTEQQMLADVSQYLPLD
ncbi:MAG: DUF3106 domain-containing protein [Acidobacteriia bacterium]|nr:DUF3106 domain-containing protein [Terriglobia bacterium]